MLPVPALVIGTINERIIRSYIYLYDNILNIKKIKNSSISTRCIILLVYGFSGEHYYITLKKEDEESGGLIDIINKLIQ